MPERHMIFQHFHQFYEIFVLLDEKADHIIEGDYFPMQKYDIALLQPMMLHKSEYPPGPPRRRLVINFSIPQAETYLDDLYTQAFSVFNTELPMYRFPREIRARLFGVLNEIFNLGLEQPPMMKLLTHCKFLEFLCLLCDNRNENCYTQESDDDPMALKIHTLTSYIHTHYNEELSLEALARHIYVSPYYLSHQFKEKTGFTLINYIQMTRIRNAQQYLLNTNVPISEILGNCGFTSFSQFNRVFHKFCRSSPSHFRAEGLEGKIMEWEGALS
jgi:AraC-like DNA-binding protein